MFSTSYDVSRLGVERVCIPPPQTADIKAFRPGSGPARGNFARRWGTSVDFVQPGWRLRSSSQHCHRPARRPRRLVVVVKDSQGALFLASYWSHSTWASRKRFDLQGLESVPGVWSWLGGFFMAVGFVGPYPHAGRRIHTPLNHQQVLIRISASLQEIDEAFWGVPRPPLHPPTVCLFLGGPRRI